MYNCYHYQRQSHIISSKNATAGAVENSDSDQDDQLRVTTLELRRGFILPAHDITVPGSTILFQRLRFRLKWVLNRIVEGLFLGFELHGRVGAPGTC